MARRTFDSSKKLTAEVENGHQVTLRLMVDVTFVLPQPISQEEEIAAFQRLIGSDLRHEIATDLERIWRGEAEAMPGGKGREADPATPESAPAPSPSGARELPSPPPFSPNRRGSQAPRTPQQQIVVHLEGPRFGFEPSRRDERLAFTSWLAGLPNLLTSTNDLSTGQAQTVLQDIATARDPAGLVQQWQDSRLSRPPSPPPTSILDEPLGF